MDEKKRNIFCAVNFFKKLQLFVKFSA